MVLKHCFNMPNQENNVSLDGNIWKYVSKLGNIVFATKTFLNLLGNIFASWEVNFVSATMFPEVDRHRHIDRKHNVSATMFPSLPRALVMCVIHLQNTGI